MADKQISQLIAAETVNDEDLLVLQQGQIAKKLTGKKLGDYLYAAAAEKIAEVNEAVAETQEAVDELEEQKNTIAQTIADMAELGTDTTLTTPGMAGDAKATGDRIGEVEVEALASLNQKTVSNAVIASFNDGADDVPIKELIIDINAIQSGSGDPISGWTGANVWHTGANLLGGDALKDAVVASMPSAGVSTENKYVSFAANASVTQSISALLIFKENTQYTFIMTLEKTTGTSSANLRVNYTDGTNDNIPAITSKSTVVFVSDANKTIKSFAKVNQSGTTRIYYEESGIFEGVLTAEDFEPYQGTTRTISWETEAGTVYGGKLNVTSGKLLVDTGVDDLSLLTWTERYTGATNKAISASLSSAAVISQGTGIRYIDGIAEQYINRGQKGAISDFSDPDSLDVGFYCIAGSSTTNTSTLYLVIPVANSAAGKIKYKLYNSTTEYNLDPVVIKTLYKENNIWADTGNINSLIYYSMAVDNNYVIEKMRQLEGMISGVEPSGVASTNYVSGSLIISKDVLVRLTANIVSGETISTGTGGNAIETTIEAELQAIKNSIPIVAGDISYDDTETYPEYTVGSELKSLSLEEASQSEKIDEKADYYYKTATGSDLEILNAIPETDVKTLKISIPYSQAGTGTPSMSNVRTITCATELTLSQKGSADATTTEHTFDLDGTTPVGVGELTYNGDGTWTLAGKYVLVTVPYTFFSSSNEISWQGSTNQWYFRNAFYNSGNGITYRNRTRRWGGWFCISNCFSIYRNLNDSNNSSSQYRLVVSNQNSWATSADVLADIRAYYDNGGTVQFLYEPTDSIPSTTYTSEELDELTGTDYFTTNVGEITVSYKVDLLKEIENADEHIDSVEEVNSLPQTDILTANDDAVNKIWSSRWLRSETAVPLSLLWFTDLHRWQTPLDRVIKFKNYLQTNGIIDGSIVTGDIVRNSAEEGNTFKTFWEGTSGTENIMIALGNHDHYAQSATPHGRATFETLDNLFFGNASNWGVTRESNYPFYYKDYLDKGIRLIVADTFVKTAEADQTTWINNVLSDAITKNLAVVIACHYLALNSSMETQSVTIYDNSWSNNLARATGTDTMDYESTDFDLVACVTDFIADGGSFLCYMIGHTHTDIVSHPTGHPDQLIINCACASPDRSHETKLTTNDLPRYANTRTQDCFNVITFDATNKIIKCVRVGANVNMYQIPRTAFGYDVTNHSFISLI